MKALRLELNGEAMFHIALPTKGFVTASAVWMGVEPDGRLSVTLVATSPEKDNMFWDTPKISVGDTIGYTFVDVPESELAEPVAVERHADLTFGGSLPNPAAMLDDSSDPVRGAIGRLKSKLLEREADLVTREEHLVELHDELTNQAKATDLLPLEAEDERRAYEEILKDLDLKIQDESQLVSDLKRRLYHVRIASYRLESIHQKLLDRAKWFEIRDLVSKISDLDKEMAVLQARLHLGKDAITWEELLTLAQSMADKLDPDAA